MTDKTDFSLELDVNPSSGFKPLPDWVAFDVCKAYPLPGGELLLHNPHNKKRALVKPEVYASLLRCDQFKTLDQHVAKIIELNPGMQGQQADIRKVFETMLESGMMVSAKEISNKFKSKNSIPVRNDAASPVVAIVTWERPEALERLLTSIATNCETRKIQRLYVVDDSRKPENINKNKKLVEIFSSRVDASLFYFGQDEQKALLDGLADRLPEYQNAIRFLADQSRWRNHWTSGLARNFALLLSCGRRLVVMDDDTLCDVYNPRRPKPDISFSDEPREADFFSREQDWEPRHQSINPDPVTRHMQCLGLSFSEALEVLGQNHLKPSGFANATTRISNDLHSDSPILVTECGSLGCPGTGRNTWLPEMAPESLKRMLASKPATKNALSSRLVWSGRNNPHFAPRPNMSAITGFDNRKLLPPYFPIMRGEDRLFGYMLDFIYPDAVSLDYPWAVPHLPIPKREWQKKDLDFSPNHSFPRFFFEKVMDQKPLCLATSPTERLKALSAWFDGMAAASAESLEKMYRDTRLHTISLQLKEKDGIEQLTAAMARASDENFPTKGLPQTMEGSELIAFWKEVWAEYATALNAWPKIRQAAAEIVDGAGDTP
jgi:hypothetical protein